MCILGDISQCVSWVLHCPEICKKWLGIRRNSADGRATVTDTVVHDLPVSELRNEKAIFVVYFTPFSVKKQAVYV